LGLACAAQRLRHAFEHLLDGRGVSGEGHRHLQALGGDIADRGLARKVVNSGRVNSWVKSWVYAIRNYH
jgi:hypothetical protein